jgi:hypothetical protein
VWQRRVGAGDQRGLAEVDPESLAWDAEHPTWPTHKPVFIGGQTPQEVHWCEVSTVEVGLMCDGTRDSCVEAG